MSKEMFHMERQTWMDRIVIDASIHHGEPCIKHTRIPVSMIIGSLADGDTAEEILAAYPALSLEDIQAALHYAAEAVREAPLLPLMS
jgi:uncharacterized protein (DUF433 family)